MRAQRLRVTKREWLGHYGVPAAIPLLTKDFDEWDSQYFSSARPLGIDAGGYYAEEPARRRGLPRRDSAPVYEIPAKEFGPHKRPAPEPPKESPYQRTEAATGEDRVVTWLDNFIDNRAAIERARVIQDAKLRVIQDAKLAAEAESARLVAISDAKRAEEWHQASEIVCEHMRYVRVRYRLPDTSTIEAQYDLDTHRGVKAWRNDSRKFDWALVGHSLLGAATAAECWVS